MLRNAVIAAETSLSIWLHLSENHKVHNMQYLQSIMQNTFYTILLPFIPIIIFDFNPFGILKINTEM